MAIGIELKQSATGIHIPAEFGPAATHIGLKVTFKPLDNEPEKWVKEMDTYDPPAEQYCKCPAPDINTTLIPYCEACGCKIQSS